MSRCSHQQRWEEEEEEAEEAGEAEEERKSAWGTEQEATPNLLFRLSLSTEFLYIIHGLAT